MIRLFFGLLACAPFSPGNAAAKPADPPDLLIITVDDMNADSIGAFGSVLPGTTPNINRLAEDGL